jgi:hypothetical protein
MLTWGKTIGPETVMAREVVRVGDGVQSRVLYWYDIDGRIVSNPFLAKAYTFGTVSRTSVRMVPWS